MAIAPAIITPGIQANANLPPPTDTQQIETTLFVRDRQPFMIGGLYTVTKVDNSARVPFLGQLPIIGKFFGNNSDTTNRNEILIIVKPTIISENDLIATR